MRDKVLNGRTMTRLSMHKYILVHIYLIRIDVKPCRCCLKIQPGYIKTFKACKQTWFTSKVCANILLLFIFFKKKNVYLPYSVSSVIFNPLCIVTMSVECVNGSFLLFLCVYWTDEFPFIHHLVDF